RGDRVPESRINIPLADMNRFGVIEEILDIIERLPKRIGTSFLRELLYSDQFDASFKDDIIAYLIRSHVPYDTSRRVPHGNSLDLRRASLWWRATVENQAAVDELLGRLNDGDQWDLPDVSSRMRLREGDVTALMGRARRDGDEGARAAALVAMHGTMDQVA